jgi:predicted secreted protein
MKKLLICLLVLLLMTCSGCTETMTVIEPLDMRVYLSQTEFTCPQEVEVTIIVYNHTDEDGPGKLALYWPDGTMIEEFGTPALKAGEWLEWTGTWAVTQNQINAGKVRFGVQYTGVNSLGLPVTKEGYVAAGIIALDNGESPARPVLVMASNPSTGYDWSWEIDHEAVVAVSAAYVPDMYYDVPDMIPPVGGGGRTRIQLTGLNPGEATITFTYKRPWEEKSPLYVLVYRVRVDEDLNVTILGSNFDW